MGTKAIASLVAVGMLAIGAGSDPAAAQAPGEDELVELVRQGLAALRPLAQPPPCDQVAEPSRWADAGARLIYNRDSWEPPFLVYEIGAVFRVFGSRLDEYTPESIAAAHDACGIVMPHAYDAGPDQEVAQFQLARAMGADGVQTNQPSLIGRRAVDAIPSRRSGRSRAGGRGLPGEPAQRARVPGQDDRLTRGSRSLDLVTGRGGCVAVPGVRWSGAVASFAGDGAVRPASTRLTPRR